MGEVMIGWYLSRVDVLDCQSGAKTAFVVERWLAVDEDDGCVIGLLFKKEHSAVVGLIERVVPAAGPGDRGGEALAREQTRAQLTDGHVWLSVFLRPPASRFTRVQRFISSFRHP